ncbi:hypothetical protein FNV43_RR01284 [Rhamnella rubrinervis]|uniref:DUF569 domain-containing protein n=1 Tax=Rhamnella rubrinervis TaxID=2594499 RepID=A0A8K0HS15_9ROSA|nr:hypothetical protein FNV43_RR01284 [Rhamnella rubrinervis]
MFHNGMVVKLQSYHEKYLLAVEDQKSVIQGDNVATNNAEWTVESVPGSASLIRLKSCYGKYLTASDELFLVGFTGFQVHQTPSGRCPDSSIEWEPIRGANQVVQLKNSRSNTFLRANTRWPPWRYSVTHKVPSSSENHYAWNLVIVATTEKSSFSRPKMQANQRVPAPAPAPAPTSGQGFMQSANQAINTANLVVHATNQAAGFTNPEVSHARNAPMGDTTPLDDAGNKDVCLNPVPTTNPGASSGCFCGSNNIAPMPAVVPYDPPLSESEKQPTFAEKTGKAIVDCATVVGAGAAVLALF